MTRRKVAEERRKEIIAGLYECLAVAGYQEVTIKDIAKAAHVSYGALHYYFENKKDIVSAFLEEYVHEEEGKFQAETGRVVPAWERLAKMISVLAREMIFDRKANNVFYNLNHLACFDDDIRRCLLRAHTDYRRAIRETIEYGISRGEFPPADSQKIALLLVGAVEGLALQVSMDPDICDRETAEKYLFEIARLELIGEPAKQELTERARESL